MSNVVTFQSQYINADILVDASLCARNDEDLHEKALDVIESLHVLVKYRGILIKKDCLLDILFLVAGIGLEPMPFGL